MLNERAYNTLLSSLLPSDLVKHFDLVDVRICESNESPCPCECVNLYLEEKPCPPDGRKDALANGFYEESLVEDFPLRDRTVTLHIKRRRWKDAVGKSLSNKYQITANGTRFSVEFADFLKEYIR